MTKFVERVEAMQYDGENIKEIESKLGAKTIEIEGDRLVCTLGAYTDYCFEPLNVTDWVVKRSGGSQVFKHEIFTKTYELAE